MGTFFFLLFVKDTSLFFGFFLYKKKPFFHQKIFVKCNPLFCVYSPMIKLQLFLCGNKLIAFFLLFSYFYLYLLVSFHGSFLEGVFLSFQQFVFSYFAFKTFFEGQFFEVNNLYEFHFLTFYHVFVKNYTSLQYEENKTNLYLFYALNSLFFIYLLRENDIIKREIGNYQERCEILLSSLQNKEKQ